MTDEEPFVMEVPEVKAAVLAYIEHGLYRPSFLLDWMRERGLIHEAE